MSVTTLPRSTRVAALSLLFSIFILITLVLPAEYGWDPLGTGQLLGLMGLSDDSKSALRSQPTPWHTDEVHFELAPFEALEYKYRLEQGAALVFSWHADGEVLYDMHSEPDGAAPGYAASFAKARGRASNGNYTAPFSGIHGWYWQNRGTDDVTIRLSSAGFYRYALVMTDGRTEQRDFDQASD